jgi:hypothetical protein
MTFPEWWRKIAEAEPEHYPVFVALELDAFEALRDLMARLADLEAARSVDRAELADRGFGAVGFLPDDDDEVIELRAAVDALRRCTPWGYTGDS